MKINLIPVNVLCARTRVCGHVCELALAYVRIHTYVRTTHRLAMQMMIMVCAFCCVCARLRPCGVDRVRLGLQAFGSASAFNANISAWNTARTVDMSGVCAILAGGALRGADALGRCSMRRGYVCGNTADVRALAFVRVYVCARTCLRTRTPLDVCIFQRIHKDI